MRLGSVKIENFRSISSCEFVLNSGVVALVGGNESGKSNVLLAIEKFLNQDEFVDEDKYQLANSEPIIEITFNTFAPSEKEQLGTIFGGDEFTELTIRRVGVVYDIISPTLPEPVEITEPIEQPEESETKLEPEKIEEISEDSSANEVPTATEEATEQPLEVTPPVDPEAQNDSSENTELDDSSKPPEKAISKEDLVKQIIEHIPNAEMINSLEDLIVGNNVPISELYPTDSTNKKEEKPMSDGGLETVRRLLELGGITEADVKELNTSIRAKKLIKGAALIAQKLRNSWQQEDIKMIITADSKHLSLLFRDGKNIPEDDREDDTKWIWTLPRDRSTGFRWYVTFYVRYLSKISESDNVIFLIDDAGLALNKLAQNDLLKEFMKLASDERNTQILYVTHSKYMVDWDIRNQIRLAIKKPGEGTKIEDMWWEKYSKNELPAPLDELGVTWVDDFLNHDNLIVEGYTDVFILHELAELFSGSIPSDSFHGYKVLPAGGTLSAIPLGKLCKVHHRKAFLLFDSDTEGLRGKTEAEKPENDLQCEDIQTLVGSTGYKVVTIEDLLPKDSFIDALNKVGGKHFKDVWPQIKTLQKVDTDGIIKAAKQRLVNEGLSEQDINEFFKTFKYDIVREVLNSISLKSYTNNSQTQSIVKIFSTLSTQLSK